MQPKMFVVKRGGRKEPVMFDKITSRIQKLSYGLNLDFIDPPAVTLRVINWLYSSQKTSGMSTVELDNKAAEISMVMSRKHPDYAVLAARIAISNLHKETKKTFSEVVDDLYNFKRPCGDHCPRVSEKFYKIVKENSERLNSAIIYDRDFSLDYFGFKILERDYLKKINGTVVERPQHMFMRVAVAIHNGDIDQTIETYNLLSERWYMHNKTTLKNAGTRFSHLSSIYSMTLFDDSIDGIYNTLKVFGLINREGGDIGLDIHCLRSLGSYIAGTNGTSNGLLPMLRVYETIVQIGMDKEKKCPHKLAIFLEPWHFDIQDYLNLKKATGKDEHRANQLHYAIWVPDLFMKRVEEDQEWSLFCPHDVSYTLSDSWGKEFEDLYTKYEEEGRFLRKIKARELWFSILESQIETGCPSIIFKDSCNCKGNLQHLGTIKGTNYHCDSIVYTSPSEVPASMSAVIALNMFVKQDKSFDFERLKQITKILTKNLDKMIDQSDYPVNLAEYTTKKHRPLSIGLAGLADTFISMRYEFDSSQAKLLNKQIGETIYYGALEASCELAKEFGVYESYEGSPMSKGVFQFDMWDVCPEMHDWRSLKEEIAKHGVRNSVLVAGLSTELPAQILGCTESFEPLASNVSSGEVSFGQFRVINPHLLRDLTEAGIWNEGMEKEIIERNGSIQEIETIPPELKNLYKTVWEIQQKTIVEMSIDRAPFIDQSQCLNIHFREANYDKLFGKLTSLHFFAWKSGLKTSLHQLRTFSGESNDKQKTAVNGVYKELLKDVKDLSLSKDVLVNGNMGTIAFSQETHQ